MNEGASGAGQGLVPIVVGVSVWLWNVERTEFQTTATMTQIAIGVLTREPAESGSNALREWAINVLRNSSNPPELSEAAAMQLSGERIWRPAISQYGFFAPNYQALDVEETNRMVEELQRRLNDLSAPFPSDE
jgi:hypothetical protein